MKFNWWTFLFEVFNFVVLAYILYRLLYRPLRKAIEQRQEATAKAQADAQRASNEATALQQQLKTQMADLERQRQESIHAAREQAKDERKKLLAETEAALEQRREESRLAMENEHREALKALHGEVVTQAIDLTRRLLREATDQTLDRQLALRLVQSLQELSEADRAELQAQIQPNDGAVLETAQVLDAPTLEQIGNAVTAAVGKPVTLTVQTKPALVGGVRLRVGGQVWDGSLAGQLEDGVR